MTLYHGSGKIVTTPAFGVGNLLNDYGLGFYCTERLELAKEWACSENNDGFANRYELDMTNLSVLRLNEGSYHILNWLAILLENRRFDIISPISREARDYILANFLPNYQDYDIITGYRADDSYFSFSRAFLENGISLSQLSRAMKLGKLGEQVVLKSEKAFKHISFEEAVPVKGAVYYPKKADRDLKARRDFFDMKKEPHAEGEYFMLDILRQKWTNDDPRI